MGSRSVTGVSNFSLSHSFSSFSLSSRRWHLAWHCTGEKEGSRGNVSSIYAFSLSLSFIRSFVRSNRGPITRSEPDSRSRFLDFVARNTIHRSTFPRSLSPSVLESTLPLGSTPRFTVARRDTRSSGIQRWTKTTESRSKEVKKRARMDNGLARSVTRKSR